MKTLLRLAFLFISGALAFAQSGSVPVCNNFNAAGQPIDSVSGTTNCTDYFGVGNWANSPLPAGTITGFNLIASGSGYANPVVVIVDSTGTGATATATFDLTTGAITGVTGTGTNFTMPQVTIVDVGVGGTLAAPMCGGNGQPVCGSGALATAIIGSPFTAGTGLLKFQDALPDLRSAIATPDKLTFPNSDFYIIGLVQYTTLMHANLPPTTIRGYCQLASATATTCTPSYLGPVIVATKNVPVRVLFKNLLTPGSGGNLFIPVDTTYMGANLPQNRATLHLHGGATPWISDGTPHQWTTPVGDTLMRGPSTAFVPDMFFDNTGKLVSVPQCNAGAVPPVTTNCWPGAVPAGVSNDPGPGAMTFFWTNEQGGRMMFYHDHSYGITRLNVYAGEAAGYLLVDPAEESMLAAGTAPGTLGAAGDLSHVIPLVIQDKTFVPSGSQLAMQDPTWTAGGYGTVPGAANAGDLWFPHVYTPNQNPADAGGGNAFGRWDYGAWFFPPQTTLSAANPPSAVTNACTSAAFPGQLLQSTTACPSCGCPITPNPSGTPEAFMDTPIVNGKAYPVLKVDPAAYRFQILSAGNDRSWNLSWFLADATQGSTEVAMVPAVSPTKGAALPLCTMITPITMPGLDMGLTGAILDSAGNPLNGTGLPPNCWPNYGASSGIPKPQTMWAADGRAGGVPDPRTAGPAWIQIGTEGGLLPAPVVIPPTPVNYEYNTRSVTVTNVAAHGLWLGPAERADVIVDFSKFAGQTLILYNDAPTPAPGFDSRDDYFTGNDDQTPIGGAPSTQPGYGPNTRTIMQVIVGQSGTNAVPFSLPALKASFASTATTPGAFAATQPTTIVPEAAYNSAYHGTFPNSYAAISATTLTFTPLAPLTFDTAPCAATPPATCANLAPKAIQELFTLDYGRMNATLGTELPLTSFQVQTTIPLGYVDPPTEIIRQGDTELWKITHNGVDTHFVHFHLFNVQVINRMGWDGTIRPPEANEVGWKDTVRMNPLEDILVALQPITPTLPWPLPDSIRLLDVTMPAGATGGNFSNIDPLTGNAATTVNNLTNFGWEYVWHCHILGHEENDMMRPMVFMVPPPAPANLSLRADPWAAGGMAVNLYWTDMSASVVQPGGGFNLKIATDSAFTQNVFAAQVPGSASTGFGSVLAYPFTPIGGVNTYFYEVQAFTPNGTSAWTVGSGPIQAALTTTNVTTNTPIVYGQTGVVTVTVSSPQGIPTGNVDLSVDGGAALLQSLPGLTPDSATFNLSGLTAITHTVTGSYPDPANPSVAMITPSSASALLAVGPAPLIITGPTLSIPYGSPVPTLTATFAALVNGDTQASLGGSFGCTTTYTVGSPVGSYPTTCSGAVNANYAISYVVGAITVTQALASVTPNAATKVYGTTDPVLTGTLTGFLPADGITAAYSRTTGETVAGSPYIISATLAPTGALSNYSITYNTANFTITPAAASVTPNAATKVYGTVDPVLTGTLTGFLPADGVTATYTRTAGETVAGSPYIISGTLTPIGVLGNYAITYNTANFTITPAAASVTPNAATKVYGTADPAFTGTLTGFLAADGVTATYSRNVGETVAGSPYTISATLAPAGVLSNYAITYNTASFTITPAAASVTPNAATKVYGAADPVFTGTLSGFLPADAIVATYGRTAGETVAGSPYTISATLAPAGVLGNYAITYNTANFTITAAVASVTPNAATKVYGTADPVFTGTLTGFVPADGVVATYSRTPGETVGGGPYTVSATLAPTGVLANYTITYNTANFTITAATASVTPNAATKVYGATDPVLTGTLAGFLPADGITATYTRTAGEAVSSYTISATLAPAGPLANYAITYNTAAFTITRAGLTVTASSAAMIYGGAVPIISPAYAGFVNGDTSAVLTAQPVCTTTATGTGNVGNYPSSCGGAAAANYTISYVAGTVTVNAAPLTITASNGAMTYGGVVPTITPGFAGFVNGQNFTVLTTQPTCTTTATAASNVGSYPSSCSGAAATNYAISYVAGSVTVGKATSTTTITGHTPSPSNVGQAVVVSASVAPQFTGVTTGTVTINATTGEACSGSLSAGVASCSITFTTPGTRTLTATYGGDSNFAGSVSAGVAQNVVAVGVSVNPTSLAFADTTLNTNSATMSARLTNTGAALTTLSYSFTDPAYTKVTGAGNCGTTLNTNASCTIYVRFRPTTAGAHPATLNINAGTTLASVALSGNGVLPVAALGTLTPSPLVATRGSTATGTVTLGNSGTGPLTITSITIGGTNAAQFTQTNNCGTSLAAGANCTVTVTFRPPANTARGNKTATLRVRDNSNGVTNSLQTTALNGTAQ